MTSRAPNQCRACIRLAPVTGTCEAFPAGIPSDMLFHGGDHREALPGDGGVRFQQSEEPEAIQAFADWQETFA